MNHPRKGNPLSWQNSVIFVAILFMIGACTEMPLSESSEPLPTNGTTPAAESAIAIGDLMRTEQEVIQYLYDEYASKRFEAGIKAWQSNPARYNRAAIKLSELNAQIAADSSFASNNPEEIRDLYVRLFKDLGIKSVALDTRLIASFEFITQANSEYDGLSPKQMASVMREKTERNVIQKARLSAMSVSNGMLIPDDLCDEPALNGCLDEADLEYLFNLSEISIVTMGCTAACLVGIPPTNFACIALWAATSMALQFHAELEWTQKVDTCYSLYCPWGTDNGGGLPYPIGG